MAVEGAEFPAALLCSDRPPAGELRAHCQARSREQKLLLSLWEKDVTRKA